MRIMVVAALLAVLVAAAPAGAATRLKVKAPSSATAGTTIAVKVTGPKTGKVRIYRLTRNVRRSFDRPVVRGKLRRGKVTLKVKIPSTVRVYRLIACLEGRKLKCASYKKVKAVAKPVVPVATRPASPPPLPQVAQAPPGRPAANPLTIALAPDRSRTATARVTSAGGSVSATGADGTVFRVTIPAGALAAPVDVSVTPAGHAVVLEPAGLGFAHPADVAIGVTSGDPMAFAVDGAEAYLVPQTFDDTGAVHVALRRLQPVGVTSEDWSVRVPTGEADAALHRIAVAKWRWAHGQLSPGDRDAEWAAALQRWAYGGFPGDFDNATIDFLAWQDAGGGNAALSALNAQALRGEAERAPCDLRGLGRLVLFAQLDRELDYGLGIDPAGCGSFSIERTVSYAYDTDAYGDASWQYGPEHRSYTVSAAGTLAYSNGEVRAVLRSTASDWRLSRHAVSITEDCARDYQPLDTRNEGSTPVELDLGANLGVTSPPGVRVTDGAQGITLQGIDMGDGFDCGPPVPVLEPANEGALALTLDAAGRATSHTFTSAPISGTAAFARTTVDTAVAITRP
jgi:hypothetical protein